jgi:hypothetical protein
MADRTLEFHFVFHAAFYHKSKVFVGLAEIYTVINSRHKSDYEAGAFSTACGCAGYVTTIIHRLLEKWPNTHVRII